jgi:alkylated DNA nucleotide flippase Atl1
MSTTELKRVVDEATPEERLFLLHYLAHLRRVGDPKHAAELGRRMKEMDQGKKISWSEVKNRLSRRRASRS